MATTTNFFFSFFLISSLVYVAFSEGPDLGKILDGATIQAGGDGGGLSFAGAMPCMQKLIACKPYLNASSTPPPSTCCDPLNDMIVHDTSCLCNLFSNPHLLQPLNISQTDILKLPDGCGITVDVSVCKKATTTSSESASSSDSSITDSTPSLDGTSNAPINIFGGFDLVVSSMVLVMVVA